MRDDLRPYWVKRAYLRWRAGTWTTSCVRSAPVLGRYSTFMKPRYVIISGPNIHIGDCFTAVAEPMHRVEIGVWGREAGAGTIRIGRCVLMSPGSRISASDEITIGDGVMMANGTYITDSDWHTVYDRTRAPMR
jgi:acetyltransferase-like isoleucine patch superfamily enzyme